MESNIIKYVSRNNLIVFRYDFNDKLDNYLCEINKHDTIFLDKYFNNDISILPPNITTIIFHSLSEFNQKIKDFPYNLKKIVFGIKFTKSLDYLPSSIEELEFDINSIFNNDLSNLPQSLKKITFGKNFTKSINNLPSNLEYLKISTLYNQEIKIFPKKLKYLIFYKNNLFVTKKEEENYQFEIKNLPNSLIEINYPNKYSYPIENIPQSLKILKINYDYEYQKNIKENFPDLKIYYY